MNKEYDTDAIDKLFLELSQITKARTARETRLIILVRRLSDMLSLKEKYTQEMRHEVSKAEDEYYGN